MINTGFSLICLLLDGIDCTKLNKGLRVKLVDEALDSVFFKQSTLKKIMFVFDLDFDPVINVTRIIFDTFLKPVDFYRNKYMSLPFVN